MLLEIANDKISHRKQQETLGRNPAPAHLHHLHPDNVRGCQTAHSVAATLGGKSEAQEVSHILKLDIPWPSPLMEFANL